VHVNKTYRRRQGEQSIGFRSQPGDMYFSPNRLAAAGGEDDGDGDAGAQAAAAAPSTPPPRNNANLPAGDHSRYMAALEAAVRKAVRDGTNKEREPSCSSQPHACGVSHQPIRREDPAENSMGLSANAHIHLQ